MPKSDKVKRNKPLHLIGMHRANVMNEQMGDANSNGGVSNDDI